MRSVATLRALMDLPSAPIVVVTHKRSGTHLTIDLLRRHFRECQAWKWWGENASRLYLSLTSIYDPAAVTRITEHRAMDVAARCRRPLVKTHLLLEDLPVGETTGDGKLGRCWVEWLERRGRQLYVYRDGRDVLCSAQLFVANRDGRWGPLGEFIREEVGGGISRAEAWARHVEAGLAHPGIVPIRFEGLVKDTRRSLTEIGHQLGLTAEFREPLLPRKLAPSWRSRLARRLSRRPVSTAILGRPKGLRLARWREELTRKDREFFHRMAGDTLIRLGYEESDAWVDPTQPS